jgi:hypothetical protein
MPVADIEWNACLTLHRNGLLRWGEYAPEFIRTVLRNTVLHTMAGVGLSGKHQILTLDKRELSHVICRCLVLQGEIQRF